MKGRRYSYATNLERKKRPNIIARSLIDLLLSRTELMAYGFVRDLFLSVSYKPGWPAKPESIEESVSF